MADEIEAACGARHAESVAELRRAREEARGGAVRPFRGTQEDGLRISRDARDDVGAEVHSVDEEDVEEAAVAIHRLDARRPPPLPGMRRGIPGTQVRLRLDETASVPASPVSPGEPRSDQLSRDEDGVPAEEGPGSVLQAERPGIESQPPVGSGYHARQL